MITKRLLPFLIIIVLVSTFLVQSLAYSCTKPREGGDREPKGDPVCVAGGKLYFAEVDIDIPSISRIKETNLWFVRYYSRQSTFLGEIGVQWQHSYGAFIRELDRGKIAIVKDIDGTEITFIKGKNYGKETKQLHHLKPIVKYSKLEKNGNEFIWTIKNKTVYRFRNKNSGNIYKLISITDRTGNTLTMQYNDKWQINRVTDGAGRSLIFTHNTDGFIDSVTDPMGRRVNYAYNGTRLHTATDPMGGVTRYEYDYYMIWELFSVFDPNGDLRFGVITTAVTNRVISRIDGLGAEERFWFSSKTRTAWVTNKNGWNTFYRIDQNGHVEKREDGYGYESYIYADFLPILGELMLSSDKMGRATLFGYNFWGDLVEKKDTMGNITSVTYNEEFHIPTSMTDPLGRITRFEIDGEGNVTRIIDPLGNTTLYTYNDVGRPTSVTNANGNITNYRYDQYGNLVEIVDATGGHTQFSYDLVGNLLSFTDPNGNTTTYCYDDKNQLISETDPMGNTINYEYDPTGNLISKTDAEGNTILYTYNPRNELIEKRYPDGNRVKYEYDIVGNLVEINDTSGTTSCEYDSLNRLIEVNRGCPIQYVYDIVGNIVERKVTEPLSFGGDMGSGITISTKYSYDSLNRLIAINPDLPSEVRFIYDNAGQIIKICYPNLKFTDYEYDNAGRLIQSITRRGYIISDIQYTYDNLGNTLSMIEDGDITSYEYDALSRLARVNYPSGLPYSQVNYQYDPAGNIITKTIDNNQVTSYSYNPANQLITEDSPDSLITYNYDRNGSLIERTDGISTKAYRYDYENRLIEVDIDSGSYKYQYDGQDHRVRKIDPTGNLTKYIWDREHEILEINAEGKVLARYLYGPGIDRPILRTTDLIGEYYHFSGSNNVAFLTNNQGDISCRYKYDAYGKIIQKEGESTNPYTYASRRDETEETGLMYYRLRYYDPSIGRFIQQDPVRQLGGLNLYEYCSGNPVDFIDPWGLCRQKWYQRLLEMSPEKALRWIGTVLKAVGQNSTGKALSITGNVADPGGTGKLAGRIAVGCIGYKAGGAAGAYIGTLITPGPGTAIGGAVGAVVGGILGGWAGGEIGSQLDSPYEGELY